MTSTSHPDLSLASVEQLPFLPSEDVTAVVGGYRLERRIGEGGAGAVFLAHDTDLHRPVAIKVLHPHNARDPVRRKRFLREGRVMALIDSPYVARVLQVGEDKGSPFLVMEFLEGEDLSARLRRDGALPWREALGYVWDAALALQAADAAGVTHRDVKPANLIVTGDHAKLTDFGLATQADESSSLTMEGLVPGTAAYMAPERMAGKSDRRSDIYSLGATLFVLVSGRTPFDGEDPLAHLSAHLKLKPPRVDEYVDDLPKPVADLVERMLEKDPDDRVQGYRELIDEIHAILGAGDGKERLGETGGVRGQLSLMSLTEIVQTLELGSRDARVEVTTRDGGEAVVGVAGGHVIYARVGWRTGVDAFCDVVADATGAFVIKYEPIDDLGRNIDLPTSGLLLEAMRRMDEEGAPIQLEPTPHGLRAPTGSISADDIVASISSDSLRAEDFAEATLEITRRARNRRAGRWELVPCRACGEEVAKSAKACDACGARAPGRRYFVPPLKAWVLVGLAAGLGASVGLAVEQRLLGTQAERERVAGIQRALTAEAARADALEARVAAVAAERDAELTALAEAEQRYEAAVAENEQLEEEARRYAGVAKHLKKAVPRRWARVRELPYGAVIELPSRVLFKSASDRIGASGARALAAVSEALKPLDGLQFRVQGHTDNVPTGRTSSFRSNWELSAARALSVRRLLEEQGIDPSQLSAEARGEHAPIASNDTRSGRARNRRIEIYVVPDVSR